MQNNFQISVIIPNYNRCEKLKIAIESALTQTAEVFEILVCDDGSADDSKKYVESLNNPKVVWVDCGKNGRPAVPRNEGIERSRGNWLAFLDNDDEWLPQKLSRQIETAQRNNAVFVCSNAYRVVKGENKGFLSELMSDKKIDFKELITSNFVICSSVLVRKDVMVKYGGFPEDKELRALEDYAAWLRVSTGQDLFFSSEALLMYNDESHSSIRKDSLSTEQQLRLIYKNFRKWYWSFHSFEKTKLQAIEERFVLRFMNKRQKLLYKIFN